MGVVVGAGAPSVVAVNSREQDHVPALGDGDVSGAAELRCEEADVHRERGGRVDEHATRVRR